MFYKKLTDKELLESYSTVMNYSGKPDKDLISEINNRGGIEKLKETVSFQNIKPNEIKRINKLIIDLYKQGKSHADVKSKIESEILSVDEKNQLIDICYQNLEKDTKDISINSRTIIGCIIGFLIASVIGSGISYYSVITSRKIFYAVPVIIFVVSYMLIRVLTGQSKNNWLVFVSSFLSAIISFIIGLWLVQ